MELPTTPELIERLTAAMDGAHREWAAAASPSATIGTRALKRHIWEIAFDYPRVYATANELGDGAEAFVAKKLAARSASVTAANVRHSPLGEFQYDVAWVELDDEYRSEAVSPTFRRLVLALESEFGPERAVLFDYHKLLCARADLRVMVWDADRFRNGRPILEDRLGQAEGADDGYWLLSGWGADGFRHACYDGTTRLS